MNAPHWWASLSVRAWYVIIALCAAVTAIALIWGTYTGFRLKAVSDDLSEAQAALSAVRHSSSANAEAHEKLSELQADISQEYQDRSVVIDKAIEASPEWSNDPIPSDIINGLRN